MAARTRRVLIEFGAPSARHLVSGTEGRPRCVGQYGTAQARRPIEWVEVDEDAADDGSADGLHHPPCASCSLSS